MDELALRDALFTFAAGEPLQAALFLTYAFDGAWFEEAIVADLCDRPIDNFLVVRDRNAVASEAPSMRYRKVNAVFSSVFHPKLALLVAEGRARAIIGSANLTRASFERQLELGRAFDLGPEVREDGSIFGALVEYLETNLSREVRGRAATALRDITEALAAVVAQYPGSRRGPHRLLHNGKTPIWTQLLGQLPHKNLRKVIVVSPFFEPDRARPEDPPLGPEDASIFSHLLERDFEYSPHRGQTAVSVYFRHAEGRTELPVRKLRDSKDRVSLHAQDEMAPRLHAKLLVLEGTDRENFAVALHGSPNFTTAGLLRIPPHGNSELAVLTALPPRKRAAEAVTSALKLDTHFTPVDNLRSLAPLEAVPPPKPERQGVADVTFEVDAGVLVVTLLEAVPVGSLVRVWYERDAGWTLLGETPGNGSLEVSVPAGDLAAIGLKTQVPELRAFRVRIELVSADGSVTSHLAPLNVDVPEQFCGPARIANATMSLDERIARAGIGSPPTYREQMALLEARRARGVANGSIIADHQADLDRFYRNVHVGLQGVLARAQRLAGSEYTLRRSLADLTQWIADASSGSGNLPSPECQLFLVGQLVFRTAQLLERAPSRMRERVPALALAIGAPARLMGGLEWLRTQEARGVADYVRDIRRNADALLGMLGGANA